MKNIIAMAAALLFVGSLASAADSASGSATEKTSTNPVTGTVTTTKESKDKGTMANGDKHDVAMKSTTKKMKNGKTEKEVKVKADETTKQ